MLKSVYGPIKSARIAEIEDRWAYARAVTLAFNRHFTSSPGPQAVKEFLNRRMKGLMKNHADGLSERDSLQSLVAAWNREHH